MRACLPASVVLALGVLVPASGQEKARRYCDESDPRNKCPGTDCFCVTDTLEVTFDGRSGSILHAGDLEPGATITVTVVTDTKSAHVQGWSYGVAHDADVLEVLSASMKDTDAKYVTHGGGFDATSIEKIQECLNDDPRCAAFRDGGGWISATVLSLREPGEFPIRRNSLAIAKYTLIERPFLGTVIRLTDRLKKVNSPPVAINFTIEGKSRAPITLIDGFITSETPPAAGPFLRGDANGDGRINVTDAIGILLAVLSRDELACEDALDADDSGNIDFVDGLILLRFLFDRGPAGPIGKCGRDMTEDVLGCSMNCPG